MEIEAISTPRKGEARNLARKLLKDAGIKAIPVSLQKILDYLKTRTNLRIVSFNFGEKISGMLVVVNNEEATIGFNNTHHWYRRRFTIAHEICHLLMGHTCSGETVSSPNETEANQFAGELLIPLENIKKDFAANEDLDFLAKKYAVSKESLCIHLLNCRLLK